VEDVIKKILFRTYDIIAFSPHQRSISVNLKIY
jgi:hypothetical protein